MAHTKSAKKRLRQSEQRNLRNRSTKHAIKTLVRKVQDAIAAGDLEAAREASRVAWKKIDKAAARRIIHPNTASRKKSQLAVKLAALSRDA